MMKPVRQKTPKTPAKKFKTSLKDPIEVYCRIRPLDDETEEPYVKCKDDRTVAFFHLQSSKDMHFSFKYAFDASTTQKKLFDFVCLPLVQDLLQGSNGLLFTYGITSSGKTYTMTGTPQDGGLLPRTLDVIFNSIKDCQAKKFTFKPDKLNGFDVQSSAEALQDQQKELGIFNRNKVKNKKEIIGDDFCTRVADTSVIEDLIPDMNVSVFISYIEIYNNYIYDLLDDSLIDSKTGRITSKILREDSSRGMYVFGVTELEAVSVEEALELFYRGVQRRRVSSTALNAESSRSHSVFTIRIAQAPLDPQGAEVLQDKDKIIVSQLSLVDLAGSERNYKAKNTGNQLREAGNINNSLMALRNCIEILRDSQIQGTNRMVPYRESKLTLLFKTFFEGEGKIKMIVCVNPGADYNDETIHVMRFGEMTQEVKISRPTPVNTPILGLRPGRGNVYREAIKRAKEQGVPVSEVLPPTIYSLGPEFPQLIIETFDDEKVFVNLIEFLTARIARRNTFQQDLNRRQEDFRKNLIAVDKENVQLKQENMILRMDLDAREQQVRGLEQKLSLTEEEIDVLKRRADEFKRQAENASVEASEKERMLIDQTREVDRLKIKMQEKLASEKDRLKRNLARKLAAKEAELERKMCTADEKFRQLREILNDDDCDYFGDVNIPVVPSVPSTTSSEFSAPVTRSKQRSSADNAEPEARFTRGESARDVGHSSNEPQARFSSVSSRVADSVFYKENRPPNSSQGTRGIAVANPRHRRSTSAGDQWIEHKPVGNLELNTVLQPAMKKKKSVSKLEVKDVTKSDVSKYVLQHQEQDSQGEIETQLFKADIIPSAGGGAQVIFNDVEKLRQVSPPPSYNLRKRSGDNLPLNEIEDRCTVSVECHGLPSKVMRKK